MLKIPMSSTFTTDASGRPRHVEQFADVKDMRDFRGASRFYRPHALPFEGDTPFAEETEAAEVLQAAAELKSDFGIEPLRLLRRTCRAEEHLREFIERERGGKAKGPLRLSPEEILEAMAVPGLWDAPTLRQAVDDRWMNAGAELRFLRALGRVIARWPVPDRVGSTALMLDEDLRKQGQDLAKWIEDTGTAVVVNGVSVFKEPSASSIRRKLRRVRARRGLSRRRGRPKKKTDI